MRVGIEVGGTFTDLVAIDDGQVRVVKVPSTPRSPDIGAFNAFGAAGLDPTTVTDLVHGSTVATNAILERKGAPIAFITTAGFRDILFMQRHDRRNIYDLKYQKPLPPVRRRDCFEIAERITSSGEVIAPIKESDITDILVPALRQGQYDAIAICLLSSYASAAHEIILKTILERLLPDVHITCSHEVAAEFREFERASTASLSAYVQPVISRYLDRFEHTLREAGFRGHFNIMQSNGGRMPAAAMRRNAITALLSGPAAGVVGAIRQAARSQRSNLITFDMGGTSTDVSLVQNGEASLAPETEVDGLPIRTPVLDIVTVGAGGGSLIWIDDGGMLRVGPRSAGADPGPACYGRGGTLPTVTDAHVVRGTIRPDAFLGGAMKLDTEAAHLAFADIAARLGVSVREAAAAAIKLAVANIVRAMQLVSTERGRDPRDYTLLPFGGAGPLLAAEIADEIGIREILVPPNPGVISALGLLSADYVKVQGVTRRQALNAEAPAMLQSAFATFQEQAKQEFGALGLDGALDYSLEADMRFVGQAFEIPVALDTTALTSLREADLAARFAEEHQRVYLHGGEPGRKAELVSLRFGVRRRLDAMPEVYERPSNMERPPATEIVVDAKVVPARIQDAADLVTGDSLTGPALIEGYSSTIWVPPGWRATRDAGANILLQRED
ncbi:hydantoinase/oxoprolinase family protein [Acidisoma cellulosilytica]|uniref:Hydantoinase/oxoprolinase family protein n=1 Tax=Acidisoma cellulosilyticum TaxID=2802395 RepID=A0A963Z6V7_9PROT|nr:hydantoinase/oxoprolinase family protein [Acidisoma cellulosilyticum]MCB8883708.1 hydantoinase/oxoprolinase family protein [Acidisoma cellulosilyticum]